MYLRLYQREWNAAMQRIEREERDSDGRASGVEHPRRIEAQAVQDIASKLVRPN